MIIGEVGSSEALDMLQAMNTEHSGSIATIHANTPRDSLALLVTIVKEAPIQSLIRRLIWAIGRDH